MIDINNLLKIYGQELALLWGKDIWIGRNCFDPLQLDTEELLTAVKEGVLSSFALFKNGQRLKRDVSPNKEDFTLLVREIEQLWPWIGEIGATLAEIFKRPYSDTSIVISPEGVSGPPVHRDPYHLLVMQTAGTKKWRLWNAAHDTEIEPITLQSGDMMHVPAERLHTALPVTASTHLAFKFR